MSNSADDEGMIPEPPEPEWKRRLNAALERMRRIQAEGIERHNDYGRRVYHLRRQAMMAGVLDRARMGTLESDWRDRLTIMDYTALLAKNPGYRFYSDIDALILDELRLMSIADWEPNRGVGWRCALDAWRDASHAALGQPIVLTEQVEVFPQPGTPQPILDLINLAQDFRKAAGTIGRVQEIGHQYAVTQIEAQYRAGLCAGGTPVDWRGWLKDQVLKWPEGQTRTAVLAQLQEDPCWHEDWVMLPEYWRQ
jgi:hypothetical protein